MHARPTITAGAGHLAEQKTAPAKKIRAQIGEKSCFLWLFTIHSEKLVGLQL